MSAPPQSTGEPLTEKRQLSAYLEAGCKPAEAWRIGTEHEKFGFTFEDLRPLPYEGPRGIEALLTGLVRNYDWRAVTENGKVIPGTRTETFIEATKVPVHVPLSGATMEFDASGTCAAGC